MLLIWADGVTVGLSVLVGNEVASRVGETDVVAVCMSSVVGASVLEPT